MAHGDSGAPGGGARYRWLSWFILRQSGLPFELLEGLALTGTARLVRRLLRLEAALERRAAAAAGGRPPGRAALAAWSLHERLLELRQEAEAEFQRELAQALLRLAGVAARPDFQEALFLSNPQAAAHLTPVLPALREGRRLDSRQRQKVLRLALYLQRFCARNDTISFFGPFSWGRIRPRGAAAEAATEGAPAAGAAAARPSQGPLAWAWDPSHAPPPTNGPFSRPPARRPGGAGSLWGETFVSHWAAAALASAALAPAGPAGRGGCGDEPCAGWRPLRLSPACLAWEPAGGERPGVAVAVLQLPPLYSPQLPSLSGPLDLSVAQARLVRGLLAWGPRGRDFSLTVGQVLERAQQDSGLGEEEARKALRDLVAAGVLQVGPQVPAGLHHPLPWLEACLGGLTGGDGRGCQPPGGPEAGQWRQSLRRLEELRRAFAAAGLDDRRRILAELEGEFSQATGLPSRRGQGAHYADRAVVYEDCLRRAALEAGEGLARDLEGLVGPCLDLWLAPATAHFLAHRRAVAEWARGEFPGGGRVPLLLFAGRLLARPDLVERLRSLQGEAGDAARAVGRALEARFAAARGGLAASGGDFAAARGGAGRPPGPPALSLTLADVGCLAGAQRLAGAACLAVGPVDIALCAGPEALSSGRYRLVLSEVHTNPLAMFAVSFGYFCPDLAAARAEAAELASLATGVPGGGLLNLVRGHPDRCLAIVGQPALDVECGPVAASRVGGGPGAGGPQPVVSLAELEVDLRGPLPALSVAAAGGTGEKAIGGASASAAASPGAPAAAGAGGAAGLRLAVITPDALDSLALRGFGFPSWFGRPPWTAWDDAEGFRPRVEVEGRLVLQRATWKVAAAAVAGDKGGTGDKGERAREEGFSFDLFCRLTGLALRLGLPRHVFVRLPGEPKPIYVDTENYLLLHLLVTWARRAPGLLEFTEMLPGPGELWLHDGQGHYTSELRLLAFRVAGAKERGPAGPSPAPTAPPKPS